MKLVLSKHLFSLVFLIFFISGCSSPFGNYSQLIFKNIGVESILVDDKGSPSEIVATKNIEWLIANIDENNVQSYEISVGTSPGATDTLSWLNVGKTKTYDLQTALSGSTTYYVNVRYIAVGSSAVSDIYSSAGFTTPSNAIEKIATGLFNTCALSKAGAVKCWGSNSMGQIGYTDSHNRGDGQAAPYNMASITPLDLIKPAKDIIAGGYHMCAILIDDSVKCWGHNGMGQLGYDDAAFRGGTYGALPMTSINLGQPVKSISLGVLHSCALLLDNSIKCWGDNSEGQLGYDDLIRRGNTASAPYNMASLQSVNLGQPAKQISVGDYHSCALLIDDTIKCWGDNFYGELGYDDNVDRGGVATAPNNMSSLVGINFGQPIKVLQAGGYSNCIILQDDSVKCWGANGRGQLGYDDSNNRGSNLGAPYDMASLSAVNLGQGAKSIRLGEAHTCAHLMNDTVKCWGYNSHGQLGADDSINRGDGSVAPNDMASITAINLGQDIKSLSLGYEHSCAVLVDDTFKCWGGNGSGQLGYDDILDRSNVSTVVTLTPASNSIQNLSAVNLSGRMYGYKSIVTSRFAMFTCGIRTDDSLSCWGNNDDGQLGYDDVIQRGDGSIAPYDMVSLEKINLGQGVKSVSLGQEHVCAILMDDTLRCWGGNMYGQLGYDDPMGRGRWANPPYDMASLQAVNLGQTVKSISLGSYHSCVILFDDSVKCWGQNYNGQLGYDEILNHGDNAHAPYDMGSLNPVNLGLGAKSISASERSTCAILTDDSVKCWGDNSQGQLGYDDTLRRGDGSLAPYDMASLQNVNLGQGAKNISLGQYHSCALLLDDTLKCWGENSMGQLGYDDSIIRGNSAVAPYDMASLPVINLGQAVKSVSTGYDHTCVILTDDSVKCWGNNNNGELGYDDLILRGDGTAVPYNMASLQSVNLGQSIKKISLGYYNSCVVLLDDSVKCWGNNRKGQLGYDDGMYRGYTTAPNDMASITAISFSDKAKEVGLGKYHTCALLTNGIVKCWGLSDWGQLGYDDVNLRGRGAPAPYDMANLPAVNLGKAAKSISLGLKSTCAILIDNKLKCWGNNGFGQLGYDNVTDQGSSSGINSMSLLNTINLGQGVKSVSLGFTHTCAILMDDSLRCWGNNGSGQLGYDDTNTRGDGSAAPYDMASLQPVNLGQGVKAVSTGKYHTCAILLDDSLRCWGGNYGGLLGYDDSNIRGDGSAAPYNMASLQPINLGLGQVAKSISLSEFLTCAILFDGSVKCWGNNLYGQLGYDDSGNSRGDGSGAPFDMVSLPTLNLGQPAKSISTSESFSCAFLSDDSIKCWGKNAEGALGVDDNDLNTRGDGSAAPYDMASLLSVNLGQGAKAVATSMGFSSSCAILSDDKVKCWGGSGFGQLGHDDNINISDTPPTLNSVSTGIYITNVGAVIYMP